MGLTITHTSAAGTILEGTCRGDGTAELVKPLRWRWSRNLAAWYVPRSRDTAPQRAMIQTTAATLLAAGHDVQVLIDDTTRPTVEVEADKTVRAADRADRLQERAALRVTQAAAASDRADRAADRLPPMGEPVKLDHYSAPGHLRAIDRAHRAMDASVAATVAAREAGRRADAAAGTTGARYGPGTVANRISGLQAEQRRIQRELDGYSRRINGYVEVHAPTDGARREQLQSRLGELDDQIRYWTEVRGEQLDTGQATGYSAGSVHPGDLVIIRGRVRRVVRANKTTVTVRTDHSWNDRVPWHEIRARITEISVPDHDAEPGAGMPIYEGMHPQTALVDGTYTALLSNNRHEEPLEVLLTIASGQMLTIDRNRRD